MMAIYSDRKVAVRMIMVIRMLSTTYDAGNEQLIGK